MESNKNNAYRRINCKTSESWLRENGITSDSISTSRKIFGYLDDLKALSVQGERSFRNRVDKVVHVDRRYNANTQTKKGPVKKDREWEWGI